MTAEALIDRLECARRTGPGQWVANCPAHDDRRPSLAIRELDDGRVLLHCFGGCAVADVLHSLGLDFAALFPSGASLNHIPPERRPFPAMDVLRCGTFEVLIAAVAAANLAKGIELSHLDRERLLLAADRLQAAVEACHA